jgi:protein O-GlcNAc transferase
LGKSNVRSNKFSFDVDSELRKAFQFHQSGQLHEAEKIYKRILEINPNHCESSYLLGVIAHQAGKIDIARDLIHKAIQNNPQNPTYYNHLGNVFKDKGEVQEAIACYQKALELKPDYAGAYYNLGSLFHYEGKLEEAISFYHKALEFKPDYAAAYYNMGVALQDLHKIKEAICCYDKALQLNLELPELYYNMGTSFQEQGNPSDAILCYQKALELKPHYPGAYNNMGIAYYHQGELNEAISCFHEALLQKQDYAEAYNNMGNALQEQEKFSEAISCYRKALEVEPDSAVAYYGMGNAFQEQSRLNEAISCLEKAIQLKPNLSEAYSHLVHQLQRNSDWKKMERLTVKLDALTNKALTEGIRPGEPPFVSVTRYADLSRNLAIAKSWSHDIARRISHLKIDSSFHGRTSRGKRIAVGYLSNDFFNHPVAHLMLNLFGLHDRDNFEVFAYSYGKDDGSHYRKRIEHDCDKFIELRHLNHVDAGRRIYDDQVDILVDLMGHTRNNRFMICALRPAPIQVGYLGFPGTTGADFIDYIITDRIVTPESHAAYYSEQFVYLPHSFQINDHTQLISRKRYRRGEFRLPESSFVFCSFNHAYKIEPLMFDVWMGILRQIPESVLWLSRVNETAESNLRGEARNRGIWPERLIFSEKLLSKEEHLARLKLADLALDTRIYNGHATTSDALWAGVPVITLQGSHFASRVSSSILTAIGLSDLIAHSLEDYEALAVCLARSPGELQAVRQRLEKNRSTEPLFDTPRFVKNLEQGYKEMWRIFLAGEAPRPIEVVES